MAGNLSYTEGKTFERIDFTQAGLARGEYDQCVFSQCQFTKTNLAHLQFTDCTFKDCDLSMAVLTQTSFKEVKFLNCKLLGLHFDHCNPFLLSFSFEDCQLNLASFYRLKLIKTSFKSCSLKEADFTGANLSSSTFSNCDFAQATFDTTILEKADLRSSFNYSIDPERNKIKKARFSLSGIAGLLDKYGISVEN